MKYINFNKISLVLLVVFLSSCSGFLDKKPLGQLTSDNFFETEEQAVWATNAIYNQLRDWDVSVFSTIGLTDIISDDADKGSTPTDASFLSELDNFTFDAENIAFGGVWRGHFRGIYRANIVIDRIPEIEMDEGLKARLLGEARFLRAFF
ncbi:MAG TPA: RagB/SusD family nutrient uptake outer membrane protein, partial [Saprospiraceae bacterium]|nr:RagB/SusD family nutrient uptake outer membrane protein [Saprospiraceae bacterium]